MYAVVQVNNYDYNCRCTLFDDKESAEQYLAKSWEKFMAVELAESSVPLNDDRCYRESDFARIEWVDADQELWHVVSVESKGEQL